MSLPSTTTTGFRSLRASDADGRPAICTAINPSKERMYIVSESALLHAIERGQLPSGLEHSESTVNSGWGTLVAPTQGRDDSDHSAVGNCPPRPSCSPLMPSHGGAQMTMVEAESTAISPCISHTAGDSGAPHLDPPLATDGLQQQMAVVRQSSASRRTRQAACKCCYEARKRCGAQRPCTRCTRLRLACIPREQRPRKARGTQPAGGASASDVRASALPGISGHDRGGTSAATSLQRDYANEGIDALQADDVVALWDPVLDRYNDDTFRPVYMASMLQQPTSFPSASGSGPHAEIFTNAAFGYASGGSRAEPLS